jgi:hypothetical protein
MWKQWGILWLLVLQQPSCALAQNAPVGKSDEAEAIVGWHANQTGRGTLSLLYICLLTIFACSWAVLHLNVPGLQDEPWTKFKTKFKWMVITILLPEFIFSKAICELRLALKHLSEFHTAISEKEGNLTSRVFYSNTRETIQVWEWQVEYSRAVRLLYPLMGLRQPNTTPVEEEGEIARRNADDEQPTSTTASTGTSDGGHVRSSGSSSKIPQEPDDDTERSENDTKGRIIADERASVEKTSLDGSEAGIGESAVMTTPGKDERVVQNGGPEEDTTSSNEEGEAGKRETESRNREDQEEEAWREAVGTSDGAVKRHLRNDSYPATRQHLSSARSTPPLKHIIPQRWTLAHAYLANMGGLLYTPNETDGCLSKDIEYIPLTGSQLGRAYYWAYAHPLLGLVLSKDDIADKSKADWLLRAIAVCQITWVILTVTARGILGLPVTQLEIATAAFSIFAVATYVANLWKPKDISRPILLPSRPGGWPHEETYLDWNQSIVKRLIKPDEARKEALNRDIDPQSRVKNDIIWMSPKDFIPLVFRLMAASAFVFGGLHCIAWNFEFPSYAELILWRTASIASAAIPALSTLVSNWLNYLATDYIDELLASWLVAKAASVAEFPSDYQDFLGGPVFSDNRMWLATMLRPVEGTRNFDKEPTLEAAEATEKEMRQAGTLEKYIKTQGCLYRSRWPLYIFLECWEKARKRDWNPKIMEHLVNCHAYAKDKFPEDVREILDDYWESYARKKCDTVKSEPPAGGCITGILAIIKQIPAETEKMRRYRNIYGRVSLMVTIGSGILYILARLIILTLLFTSLRAVPLGVYEGTPWTRFLPSFS